MHKINKFIYNIRRRLAKKLDPVSGLIAEQELAHYGGVAPTPAGYETLAQAYAQEGWVYVCVQVIVEALSRMKGNVYYKDTEGENILIPNHPLISVLKNPTPFMKVKMSQYQLWEFTHSCLELAGQAYWFLVMNGAGVPIGIIPLYPHRVRVVPSKEEFIKGYIYTVDEKKISLETVEVVHFKKWHPLNDWYGFSPTEASSMAISTDVYAQGYNRRFFQNQARPDGIIKTDYSLNDAEAQETRAIWEKSFKGVSKSHKVAVLGKDFSYEPIVITHRDMDYLKLREMNRDEILSIFRVPASMTGVLNRYRATSIAEDDRFKIHTLLPKLISIEEKIDVELLSLFGGREEQFFKFETLVSKDDVEERERDRVDLELGVLTPDEVRARRYGLPPHPNNMGATPFPHIGLISSPETGKIIKPKRQIKIAKGFPRFDTEEWEEELELDWRDIFTRQREEVLAKIEEDPDHWDDEWDRWIPIIFALTIDDINEVFVARIDQIRDFVDVEFSTETITDMASEWIRQHALEEMVTQVNQTTRRQIKEALLRGVEEGMTPRAIAENIDKFFIGKIRDHSRTIAGTEVGNAHNQAALMTFKVAGVPKKRWRSMRDKDVCDICLRNEAAGPIGIDVLFPSGHKCPLAHPRGRCWLEPAY